MISFKTLRLLALALVLTTTLGAQESIALPDGVTKGVSAEGISEYQLDNGLKVLLFPDPSKPQILVNITYLVGSRHEGYGETGMAHLLEHLVFKGTPQHPNIPQELTEHGARPNGTTWYDRTNYFETFSATEENLRWALDLEADRMVNSFIKKEDLESEMTVVRNEFEMGENSPSSILMERVMSGAYLWHNYGKTTIGARADIENVPIERLQAFYRKYYQPDNAVLLVAGKIDEAKTLEMVAEYFGSIPRPDRMLYETYTREPIQDGERSVTLKRVGEVQVVSAGYHIAPAAHPDFPALDVLSEILTNTPSGRLYKALVETEKATSQFGFAFPLKEPGYAYFSADVLKDKSVEEAKAAMLGVFDSLSYNPPTREEVERAKTKLLKDFELQFSNTNTVGLILSEFISKGDWRLAFLYRDYLEQVTVEDVIRVAKFYFKPSNRTVGIFIPESNPDRVEVPEMADIETLLKNFKGKAAVAQGEAFDPTPENINARTQRYNADNQGLEYALLPKETRGDIVIFNMVLRLGDEKSLEGKSSVGSLTAAMLDKGTANFTREQLTEKFDQLKANVRIGGDATSVSVSVQTERGRLTEVMDVLAEVLKQPTFPEEELKKLKDAQRAQLEEASADPMALAQNEFMQIMSPYPKGHVNYSGTFAEELEEINAVTIDQIREFYADYYGADAATLAVVGDFDDAEVRAAIQKHFADWKSEKSYKRIQVPFVAPVALNKNIETPDKANAMFFAGMKVRMTNSDPEYAAMVMGNLILGGGFLNSRLATRIRQQEGLSYGVGSFFNAHPVNEDAMFGAYAIYAPENVEKLEKAFKEEVARAVKEGFTAEELEAAKSGWLQQQQLTRSQDGSLAGIWNSYLFFNRDFTWDQALEDSVRNLTVDDVNRAFSKNIDVEKLVIIKAGDFAKLKQTKP